MEKWWEAAVEAYLSGRLETEYADLVRINCHPAEPMVVLNYTSVCAFTRTWDEVTRACRGLIVDRRDFSVAALPFSKFFNIGERTETELPALPKLPFTIFEKVDGSLGILYRDSQGEPCLATRGSFTSEQAIRGTEMLWALPSIGDIPEDLTLLFEIVYAENRSVVKYDFEGLVLLAIFNRKTGEELAWKEVKTWAAKLGVRTPRVFHFAFLEDVVKTQAELPADLEGYVIRFENGLRVKLKGEAYLTLQKLVWGLSQKRVLDALKAGTYETLLAEVPEEFRDEVEAMAESFIAAARQYEEEARAYFTQAPKDGTRKEFALWVQANVPGKFHPALFQLLDGKEPKWVALATKER